MNYTSLFLVKPPRSHSTDVRAKLPASLQRFVWHIFTSSHSWCELERQFLRQVKVIELEIWVKVNFLSCFTWMGGWAGERESVCLWHDSTGTVHPLSQPLIGQQPSNDSWCTSVIRHGVNSVHTGGPSGLSLLSWPELQGCWVGGTCGRLCKKPICSETGDVCV